MAEDDPRSCEKVGPVRCIRFGLLVLPLCFLLFPFSLCPFLPSSVRMATNTAIVDDRDPLIQYTGTWNGAGSSAEFHSTTTWSPVEGSTASLSFTGTSVTVYGSVSKITSQASLTFSVDGSITGTYTPPSNMASDVHHQLLWTSPTMSGRSHTLVITQTGAQTSGVIYLDYIMYTTTSTSLPYYIDDRDSRITYNPAWTQEGSDQDFQHTCSRTSSTGDSFSLKFEGNGISFYGGITSTTINASAVIDGGPPQFFGAPATATTTNNLLFKSPALSAGTHNLVITAQNAEHVWTDYFIVNPDSPSSSPESPPSGGGSPPGTTTSTSTPSQSTPSGGSHPAPASSGTSVSGSTGSHTSPSGSTSSGSFLSGSLSSSNSPSTPSSLDSDTSPSIIASSSAKSPPIAAIVASVVAVMFLIALVAAIFFCRRRCRQKASMLPKVNPLQPAPLPSFVAPGATLEVTYGDGYAAVSTTSGTSAGYLSSDNLLPSTSGYRLSASTSSNPFEDPTANSPPAPTGVLPSNKLMREAQWSNGSSSSGIRSESPGIRSNPSDSGAPSIQEPVVQRSSASSAGIRSGFRSSMALSFQTGPPEYSE